MEISSELQISLDELNTVMGTMDDAYACLSRKYYLPKRNSKAITKEYLMKLFVKDCKVLKVPRTISRNFVEYHFLTVEEMLNKLEKFLSENNHPPTGFDSFHLPDYQWIYDVIVWIDHENDMEMPRESGTTLSAIKRTIDSE